MTNATIATKTAIAPIAKLYKRCSWGSHKTCAGKFETHSVCSCPCHSAVIAAPKTRKPRAIKTPQVAAPVYAEDATIVALRKVKADLVAQIKAMLAELDA